MDFGQNPPTITITGGGGTGAEATPVLDEDGTLLGVTITNPGFGYISPPIVSLTPSNGAVVTATIDTTIINEARSIPGTNRWAIDWAPQSPGTYNISVEAIDEDLGSTKITTDRWVVITPQSSSMVPTVKLNSPDNGSVYTSGSKMYLYAQADDLDGTLEWVRFYVNGLPLGNAIPAYLGRGTSSYPYGIEWEVPAPGVYSIYAVAMDNSQNAVMSGTSTITATTGEGSLPYAEFDTPLKVADANLSPSDVNGTGGIVGITLIDGGRGYASAPTVEIAGDGTGATAIAIIGTDPFAAGYGQVVDINVTNGGSGYSDVNTTIRLIGGFPRIKPGGVAATARLDLVGIVKQGIEAGGEQPVITILNPGSGYTETPDVIIEGLGTGMTAEADILNGQVVNVRVTNLGTGYYDMSNVVTFEGGFPFEETSFTVSASDPDSFGEIEEVTLFANGLAIGTDSSAPYEFLWGAGAQGYYDLYLMVTDNQGNRNVSRILRRDVFPSEPPSFTFQPVSPAIVSTDYLVESNGSIRTGDHNLTLLELVINVAPEVVITDSNGTGATGYALIDQNGSVVDVNITNGGQGYTSDTSIRLSGGLDTTLNPIRLEFGKTLNLGVYAYDEDTLINPLGFKVFINGTENDEIQVLGNNPNYFLSWTPRFLGFFSIRVEGTTIDGEEASTSELDIEVYNENSHEISLYGLDSNVTPSFALGSMVHVPFEVSSKFGQVSNIRAFENDLTLNEIGSFDASTGTGVNISYDQNKDEYLLSWTSSYAGNHSLYIRVDFEDGSTIYSNPSTFEIIEGIDGDQLPLVNLRQPVDGLSLTEASTIRLEANAH